MLNFLENKKGGKASLKETGYATGNIPAAARLGSAAVILKKEDIVFDEWCKSRK